MSAAHDVRVVQSQRLKDFLDSAEGLAWEEETRTTMGATADADKAALKTLTQFRDELRAQQGEKS